MATGSSERRDAKLDALLRRVLQEQEYDRIVATEVCIVVFPRGKKVHGHVVLEGSYISFVPITVKNIQRLVELSAVVSSQIINDKPDFLPSKEGEKTMHLAIDYIKNSISSQSPPISSSDSVSPTRDVSKSLHRTSSNETALERLDIYLLNDKSTFLSYLTFHLEDVQLAHISNRHYILVSLDKQCAIQRYHSLKSEIMTANSIEASALLYLELTRAVSQYFQIKLIFWHDDLQLLLYSVSHVHGLVSHCTPVDKIEYCIIVLEFLLRVFQDTLVSRNNYRLLASNKGEVIEKVTVSILDLYSEINQSEVDNKSLDEFGCICAGLLYELSRVVLNQFSSKNNTISGWSNILVMHVHFSKFLFVLMAALCRMITDANRKVQIYYVVSLMLALVDHSDIALKYCISHFSEEFLYIITSPPQCDVLRLLNIKFNRLRSIILNVK